MQHIIIGNSRAGISAAKKIRELDTDCQIMMIADEEYPFYSRCLTTYYIGGDIEQEDMILQNENFYEANDIETKFGQKVVNIEPDSKKVIVDNGTSYIYDKLLIASGGCARIPDFVEEDKDGIFVLRTWDNAAKIKNYIKNAKKAVMVGGGLVSVKTAIAFYKQGLNIDIIIGSNRVLSQMVDEAAGNIIQNMLEKKGFNIKTGHSVISVKGKDKVTGVVLDDGQEIDCDLVLIGKGVVANYDFAEYSALKTNYGILVDQYMETSIPDIYAAGDVAETYDIVRNSKWVNALWPIAYKEGQIAACNMAGQKTAYEGAIGMNAMTIFDLDVVAMGIARVSADKDNYEIIVKKSGEDWYRKLVLDEGVIKGAILVGDIDYAGVVLSLIKNGVNIAEKKQDILNRKFSCISFIDQLNYRDKIYA